MKQVNFAAILMESFIVAFFGIGFGLGYYTGKPGDLIDSACREWSVKACKQASAHGGIEPGCDERAVGLCKGFLSLGEDVPDQEAPSDPTIPNQRSK